MSHLQSGTVLIKDVEALRSAAKQFGGTLEQSKVFTSYSGDSNPCEYRITLPGVRYQVGICKQDGGGLLLSHDPYDYGSQHDGGKLVAAFGDKLSKLQQQYAKYATMNAARKAGYFCQEKLTSTGAIKLQLVKA
jgi:hypothetical protein